MLYLECDQAFLDSLKVNDRVLMHSSYPKARIGMGTVERITEKRATASVRLDGDSRPYLICLKTQSNGRPAGYTPAIECYSVHKDESALNAALDARRLRMKLALSYAQKLAETVDIDDLVSSDEAGTFVRSVYSLVQDKAAG